jgi:hypothetical protein
MDKIILSGGDFGGQEFTPDKTWKIGDELSITLPVEFVEGEPIDVTLNYRKVSDTMAVFSSVPE